MYFPELFTGSDNFFAQPVFTDIRPWCRVRHSSDSPGQNRSGGETTWIAPFFPARNESVARLFTGVVPAMRAKTAPLDMYGINNITKWEIGVRPWRGEP